MIKSDFEQLAVCGGEPSFSQELHVGRPNLGKRDRLLARINEILDRNWLSNGGPLVREFERRIAEMVGVKHCIAMCNGTVALEIATRALGLTKEVIVPAFSFVATAHALQWQRITPLFCDIDPQTHTLDPERVERMITPRTTGIVGVHLWGQPCQIEALAEIADRYKLKLVFDAAHAFGCTYNGKMIGSFGDAEVFSFHATKFVNSLEGGAVATNDDDLAAKIRLMKNFGFTGYDRVEYIGINGKMNEFSAAMGLTSLESMETFVAHNYKIYQCYKKELSSLEGIHLFAHNEMEKRNYQYIILEIDESMTQLNRDQLQQVLWAENILARRYFYPGCHNMEPYYSAFPHAKYFLPEAERLVQRVLALPTGLAVSTEDVLCICSVIRTALEKGFLVQEQLEKKSPPVAVY